MMHVVDICIRSSARKAFVLIRLRMKPGFLSPGGVKSNLRRQRIPIRYKILHSRKSRLCRIFPEIDPVSGRLLPIFCLLPISGVSPTDGVYQTV